MCKHCNIKNCSILNKAECPVNILWAQAEAQAEEARQALAEVDIILAH